MTQTAPEPDSMTREALEKRWRRLLKGKDAERVPRIMLADADAYAANMVEMYARPDDRWGPG